MYDPLQYRYSISPCILKYRISSSRLLSHCLLASGEFRRSCQAGDFNQENAASVAHCNPAGAGHAVFRSRTPPSSDSTPVTKREKGKRFLKQVIYTLTCKAHLCNSFSLCTNTQLRAPHEASRLTVDNGYVVSGEVAGSVPELLRFPCARLAYGRIQGNRDR